MVKIDLFFIFIFYYYESENIKRGIDYERERNFRSSPKNAY